MAIKGKIMRTYRTEIILSQEQIEIFNRTMGTCRFVYNLYITKNKEIYELNKNNCFKKFLNNSDFSKYLNNIYLKENKDKIWIKEVSSKSIKNSIDNAYMAFKNFFKERSGYPKYKKKGKCKESYYFVRSDSNRKIYIKKDKIKIPCLGWVKLKEYGYIPNNEQITSGRITKRADKYFISVITDGNLRIKENNCNDGIGVDLGIKDFAIVSNEQIFKNINKTDKVKKIEKQLNREQRKLSRKFKNKKKGETAGQNLKSQIVRVQRLYLRLSNIRENYHNQIANTLVKTKPKYITIENLNIKGMMKNKHLSKAISKQGFYDFVKKLKFKCIENSIELRQVDTFYPSSKMCSKCGNIKKDLKLSDRTYKCSCGLVIDRDLNASLNLKQAIKYKIIT